MSVDFSDQIMFDRVGNDHKKGMSDLHEDFDPDQREGGLSEETKILNHEMGKIQWLFCQR